MVAEKGASYSSARRKRNKNIMMTCWQACLIIRFLPIFARPCRARWPASQTLIKKRKVETMADERIVESLERPGNDEGKNLAVLAESIAQIGMGRSVLDKFKPWREQGGPHQRDQWGIHGQGPRRAVRCVPARGSVGERASERGNTGRGERRAGRGPGRVMLMNADDRKELQDVAEQLSELKDRLENKRDDLQEKADNMPGAFESKREALESEMDQINEAMDSIESAADSITSAMEGA